MFTREINGREYRYHYDTRLHREIYDGPVNPAQSIKDVLYTLDDDVAERMCDLFVAGHTFAVIRQYIAEHGVHCCDATVRKYMHDNGITRYMC